MSMESINEQRCQNVIKELVGVREKGIFNKRNYNRLTKKKTLSIRCAPRLLIAAIEAARRMTHD
jgi:ribose 5-phosphate isomerase